MNKTAHEQAEELYIDCYPIWYDNGLVAKKAVAKDYAIKICNTIVKEGIRVEFWTEVIVEIKNLK